MKTADELLTQVNAFLDALPYERTPKSLYEPILSAMSCRWVASAFAPY